MKKMLAGAVLLCLSAVLCFAGDAAAFSEIGFSADGKTYIFGEYGKTDKTYQAWAEIYTVDVAKNDFVPGEVFKTQPDRTTVSVSGRQAFESLLKKADWKLKKYACKPSSPEDLLYVRDTSSSFSASSNTIVFKDYDASSETRSVYYHIRLVPTVEGMGSSLKSSFYIDMQKKDGDGKLIRSWKVGNPGIKRKGVSSYEIERIFTDSSKRSLVFIVQKTLEDSTGTSIRYMVETMRFD